MTGAAITSIANAFGGAPGGSGGSAAAATARGIGVSGIFQANAQSDFGQGNLLQSLSASASGLVDGVSGTNSTSAAYAKTGFATSVPALQTTQQSIACITGQPPSASIQTVRNANSNIQAAFGSTGNIGSYCRRRTRRLLRHEWAFEQRKSHAIRIDDVRWIADVRGKPHRRAFQRGGEGGQPVKPYVYDQRQRKFALFEYYATQNVFMNDAINLGPIANYEDANGLINLTLTMSETTPSPGSGFYSGFIVGNSAQAVTPSIVAQSHTAAASTASMSDLSNSLFSAAFGGGAFNETSSAASTHPDTNVAARHLGIVAHAET